MHLFANMFIYINVYTCRCLFICMHRRSTIRMNDDEEIINTCLCQSMYLLVNMFFWHQYIHHIYICAYLFICMHGLNTIRMNEDEGIINRYGFNSDGADVVLERLQTALAEVLLCVCVCMLGRGTGRESVCVCVYALEIEKKRQCTWAREKMGEREDGRERMLCLSAWKMCTSRGVCVYVRARVCRARGKWRGLGMRRQGCFESVRG